jgi:peptidoglycan-associated lipoprotein
MALHDTLAERIHFEFDKAEIRPEDRPVLDRKLAILRANPMLVLRIAGHADERGSDEYNLALGARRAAAARAYLVNLGIAPARLEVVSYGEEQPLVGRHDEDAWAMNRRDEYTPVEGAESLVPPMASR